MMDALTPHATAEAARREGLAALGIDGSFQSLMRIGLGVVLLVVHCVVDTRLAYFGDSTLAPGIIAGILAGVAVFAGVVCLLCTMGFHPCRNRPYVVIASVVACYLLACHATGVVVAAYNPDLRVVTALHYLRIAGVIGAAASRNGLRPAKTWALVAVGGVPLLLQPLALLFPTTWESRHAASFWRRFGMEVVGCVLSLGLSLAGSYWALGSSRAARAVRGTLLAKAARAQSLLETAMPPTVAQALLGGTPAYELSRAFGSATVAFIALDDFCDKEAEGNPTALLAWLNAVYAAFDGLVDAYGDRINKIEIVANTYIVTAGLPTENPLHAVLAACFCIDLIDLCKHVPGVGRVSIRIGINTGPVAAGLIGTTRRFYRIVGDTVNVASRMMSTGDRGRVHCSPTAAICMTSSGIGLHGLSLAPRGRVQVKGKGVLETFWLQRAHDRGETLSNTLPSRTLDATPLIVTPSASQVHHEAQVASSDASRDAPLLTENSSTSMSVKLSISVVRHSQPLETHLGISDALFPETPALPPGGIATPNVSDLRDHPRAAIGPPVLPCTRISAAAPSHVSKAKPESLELGGPMRAPFRYAARGDHPPPPIRVRPSLSEHEAGVPRELARIRALFDHGDITEHEPEQDALPKTVDIYLAQAMGSPIPGTPVARGFVTPGLAISALDVPTPGAHNAPPRPIRGPRIMPQRSLPLPPRQLPEPTRHDSHHDAFRSYRYDSMTLMQRGTLLDTEHNRQAELALSARTARRPDGGSDHGAHNDAAPALEVGVARVDIVEGSPISITTEPFSPPQAPSSPLCPPFDALMPIAVGLTRVSSPSATRAGSDTVRTPATGLDGLQRPWNGMIANDPMTVEQRLASPHIQLRASLDDSLRASVIHRDVSHDEGAADAESSDRGTAASSGRATRILAAAKRQQASYSRRALVGSAVVADVGGVQAAAGPACAKVSPAAHTPTHVVGAATAAAIEHSVDSTNGAAPVQAGCLPANTAIHMSPFSGTCNTDATGTTHESESREPISGVSSCLASLCTVTQPLGFADAEAEAALNRSLGHSMISYGAAFFSCVAFGIFGITGLYSSSNTESPGQMAVSILSTVTIAIFAVVCWRRSFLALDSLSMRCGCRFDQWLMTLVIFVVYVVEAVVIVTFASDWQGASAAQREEVLMWRILWLSLTGTAVSVVRIPFRQAAAFAVATIIIDVAFVAEQSLRLGLSVDVPLIAFVHLAVFRGLLVWASHAYECGERDVFATQAAIRAAEKDAGTLLANLFPAPIVASLTLGEPMPQPQVSHNVAILYADLAGFTRMSSGLSSMELMALLNELYARFDRLVEEAGLWKVETVGDAYIVVGGLSTLDSAASASVHAASSYQLQTLGRSEQAARLHLDSVFHLSVRMLDELAGMREHLGLPLHMRVGVHCGDVVTGIVGSQRPRFCVLGQAVTEAEHVEGSGALDHVTCTEEARRRYLASSFEFSELSVPLPLRTGVPAPPSTADSSLPSTVLSRPLAEGRFHVSLRAVAEGPLVPDLPH